MSRGVQYLQIYKETKDTVIVWIALSYFSVFLLYNLKIGQISPVVAKIVSHDVGMLSKLYRIVARGECQTPVISGEAGVKHVY